MVAHSDHYVLDDLVAGLQESGFDVHKSSNGVGCIEQMRQHAADILLLDPGLLWGGGDGVLAVMETSPVMAKIPVLFLVTFDTNMLLANSLRSTDIDFLALPNSKEAIANRCLEVSEAKGRTKFGLCDSVDFENFPT